MQHPDHRTKCQLHTPAYGPNRLLRLRSKRQPECHAQQDHADHIVLHQRPKDAVGDVVHELNQRIAPVRATPRGGAGPASGWTFARFPGLSTLATSNPIPMATSVLSRSSLPTRIASCRPMRACISACITASRISGVASAPSSAGSSSAGTASPPPAAPTPARHHTQHQGD